MSRSQRPIARHCISGPDDLLQAVPYLLGFHPRDSLVVVGLDGGRLVVTARLDLDEVGTTLTLADTIAAIRAGGARELIAVVYADSAEPASDERVIPGPGRSATGRRVTDTALRSLAWAAVALALESVAQREGCVLAEALLVRDGRRWSYVCDDDACCPSTGRALPSAPSVFAAEAVVDGVVVLPDRESLAAVLDPLPDDVRAELSAELAEAEHEAIAAVLAGGGQGRERASTRAILDAARASGEPGWTSPSRTELARLAVALTATSIRDAVWMAIDDGRVDGRPLYQELARRCPSPYDAAPLFLFGWSSWRKGNGVLAGVAAERAVTSDPAYSAADLLLTALNRGLDPHRFPKLRLPRSA